MHNPEDHLQTLISKVQSNPKYQAIVPELVMRLSQEALNKGLREKDAVKEVRKKLHQVGGAYLKRKVDYKEAAENLTYLPENLHSDEVQRFCIQLMQSHTSTAERLSILPTFFHTCLDSIAPVSSVLDLACGLNPLSLSWMPLAEEFTYQCCDIYLEMMAFLQSFFNHFQMNGKAHPCDLVNAAPGSNAQVALLLKSMPCLEQLDKSIGARLLETIQSDHILVSFPVHSLGGQKKGMVRFYKNHFYEIIAQKNWLVQEFAFKTELAFLVSK